MTTHESGLVDTNVVVLLGDLDPEDLPLYTCNPRDFAGIEDLELVAVPHPAARS